MRSSRLLSMILLLQTRGRMTAGEFAERLEVSRRTVLRDVEELSAMGVPVYTERGRGGGIVLLPGARLDLSRLEPAEIEALAVSGLDRAQREQLGVQAAHESASLKIAARASGTSLGELVVVESGAWLSAPEEGTQPADLVLDLRQSRRWEITYRRSGEAEPSSLVVDPYGLVCKAGRWYLVADLRHEGAPVPRLFSLNRLSAHEVLPENVRHRPGQDLPSVWEYLRDRVAGDGEDPAVVVTVRLRASRMDLARRILGIRLLSAGAPEDGWRICRIGYRDIAGVRQLLQFADHIEVLGPPSARETIQGLAVDLAARHGRLIPD